MEFTKTTLEGAYLVKPRVFQDNRGFFLESYSKKRFEEQEIKVDFVQDNHSMSVRKGVLRGFHFQLPPYEQAKFVRVTRGRVYDVIVDLRRESSTYGKWESFELSAENFLMLFIPRGFAHAFLTLEENTEFMYKVDNFYAPEYDSGIIWNDPILNVDWPIKKPVLSDKDKALGTFEEFIKNNPFRL